MDGAPAIVHRHNACRIFPASELSDHPVFAGTGQPLLLPGTGRTSSYVCIPGNHPERALNSVCHGAGSVVGEFARRGNSTDSAARRSTLRFSYRAESPARVPHVGDAGIDAEVELLRDRGISRPVVRLEPFAGWSFLFIRARSGPIDFTPSCDAYLVRTAAMGQSLGDYCAEAQRGTSNDSLATSAFPDQDTILR